MKNGLIIWNAVLTVLAGYLLFSHFSKKDTAKSGLVRSTVASDSSSHTPFRIAYFEMDSIENGFDMVKDIKARISKRDEEYSNQLSKLDWTYNNKYNELAQKVKSREDEEAAKRELESLAGKLKDQKQELDQEYQNFVTRQNLSIKKTIEDFLAEYNKTKNYSYIVSYEQGLFYYKDTAYDITADLIKGLNEQYKKEKK